MYFSSSNEFQAIIHRHEPSLVYFFDSRKAAPGPEFAALTTDQHPAAGIETFFVDLGTESIESAPSQVPLTVLYSEGRELDTAGAGDMPKFIELSARVVGGN
jgi:hypothetical protein